MTRPQRRVAFWSAALVVSALLNAFLTRRLAAQDPISEVLLGRAGSALPLVGLVLLLQVATILVFPVMVVVSLVGLAVQRMQPVKDEEKST